MSWAPDPAPKSTLWASAVKTNEITPPWAMVTVLGSNDVPGMSTCALAGGGPPPPPALITVMTREPEKPPALAVIVALPTATPVTVPDPSTVAADVFDDAQVNVPLTAVPAELRAVAESETVDPTVTVVVLPEIETLAIVVLPVVLPPGDVGLLLPPPPPPHAIAARASEQVRVRADAVLREFGTGIDRRSNRVGEGSVHRDVMHYPVRGASVTTNSVTS